jgi:hypothetical protein
MIRQAIEAIQAPSVLVEPKLHNQVTLIQERVLPCDRPIDTATRGWLQSLLRDILRALAEEVHDSESYRRLRDALTAVIINYESITEPGIYGGRQTATVLNLKRFRTGEAGVGRELEVLREQNPVFTYHSDRPQPARDAATDDRPVSSRDQQAEIAGSFWQANWRDYISLQEHGDQFTLNNMAMRRAVRPRPVAVSWFDGGLCSSADLQVLTPVAINLAPGEDGAIAHGASLEAFTERFAAMFDGEGSCRRDRRQQTWRIDGRSTSAMLGRLHRYFGSLGGSCFFSIPVTLQVSEGRQGNGSEATRRALVSVLMNSGWDRAFYEEAWQFFDALAHRLLTSVMASESAGHAHRRWLLQKASSIYLASHPMKHCILPINAAAFAVDRTANELLREAEAQAPQEFAANAVAKLQKISGLARQQLSDVDMALSVLSLQGLLADLGAEQHHVEAVEEERSINLIDALREAAATTTRRIGSSKSVKLVGSENLSYLIKSRLKSTTFDRHAGKEVLLYTTMFREFLKNAASYGASTDGNQTNIVDVHVSLEYNRWLNIDNAIDELAEKSARKYNWNPDRAIHASSGLYFANRILSVLGIGTLDMWCQPNNGRFPHLPKESYYWRYAINLRRN